MATPILATKLYIPPPRPKVVLRPRLIERMDEGLHHKLILISAPAGFGKTTLVSEWVAGCGQPAAWLSLDEEDNDLKRFLAYTLAALRTIEESIGQGMLGLLDSPQPLAIETVLTSLVNEIVAIPAVFTLVLDDYHLIESKQVEQAVVFLIEHLPPQMHLLIATREDPQIPLARYRARGQLTELRATDLRFTPAEAAAFLNQVMGLDLSSDDIAALEARTEGWIAGLQLAAISMQGHQDTAAFIKSFSGSHQFVMDYLVEEVLRQQSEAIQTFLLRTSILDRMCGSLCDAVLCDPTISGQQTLEYLEHANLFIVPLDNERRWNRYHHLFRDLLQAHLLKTYPGEGEELHRRASTWFASQNLSQDAVAHALAARDYHSAATLVEQAAQQLDMQNSLLVISRWIDSIPDEVVAALPWLCIYRAWGYYWVGRRDSVETWLKAAEDSLPAALEPGKPDASQSHLLGHIAAIRAHAALTAENITTVLEEGQRALDLLPERDEMRCETAVAMGGAYWALGRAVDSEQAFSVARAAALKCSPLTMAVPSTCYVGMQQAKQGRLAVAQQTYQDALRLALGPDGRETPVAGFPNIKLGDLYREWNELERAEKLLLRGVEQCTLLGQADVLVDAYVCLARFQLAAGNPRGTSESLQLADHVVAETKVDPFVLCWLEDSRLRLWIREKDYSSIAHWKEACGLNLAGPFSYHYDLHHVNLARVLAAIGAHTHSQAVLLQAVDLLGRLYEAANRAGWVNEQIHILILHALAESALGRDDAALSAISQVLSLAEPGGFIRLFVDEGPPMARLLSEASDHGVMTDYTGRLLAAFEAEKRTSEDKPDLPPAQPMVEPLSQRELEVLRLLAQGLSNHEICKRLFLALDTVKGHNRRIFNKLQVQRRTEAIARARELGLL